jgi:hypothetical protein
MKVSLTETQLREHDAASTKGAIEGTVVGGTVAFAASFWAQKRLAAYRKLPLSLKALGAIIITAPLLAIQAERRGLEYDRSQWYDRLSKFGHLNSRIFFFLHPGKVPLAISWTKKSSKHRKYGNPCRFGIKLAIGLIVTSTV